MKKILIKLLKDYILEILQEKAFKKLRRIARETDNSLDDEAVNLLEQVIVDELNRL